MKNVIDIRRELCAVFGELREGDISTEVAKELANTAGRIIQSVKLELEYAALRQERPVIPFLWTEETP